MVKRILCFIMIVLLSITNTGCWDKVEIDQRGFVGVIMIDMAPPGYEENDEESMRDTPDSDSGIDKMIKVTYAFPIASALAGESGGGGDKPSTMSISSVAPTMDRASRYVDSRVSRRLFLGFTQVVIFGEDFLKNPDKVKEVIDYLRRNPELGRSMRVLVSKGEASKVAEVEPKDEKLLSVHIRGVLNNETSNGRILDMTFNEFIVSLLGTGCVVLPKLVVKDDEIKIAGLGLIKDYKLIGYLPEYDSLYFNTLVGKRKSGSIDVDVDGIKVNYVIRNLSKKIKVLNDDPSNFEISINIRTEGALLSGETEREFYDDEFISKIEQELNKEDEENCKFVINKLQKEFNIDALNISDSLRKYYPDTWEKVKDRWEIIYPNIKIIPVFENKVRRIGTVK
ncbi:MAG TPA: hypothetical protein DD429_03775 [Clostridiaceae bacterium]|nr:hypothetical protein [Clostridiaceae bacterium]